MNTYIHAHIDRDLEQVTLFNSDGHLLDQFPLGKLNQHIVRREALQDWIDVTYSDDPLDNPKIGGIIYGERKVGAEWTRGSSRLSINERHDNGIKMHWSGTNGATLDTTDLQDIQALAAFHLMRVEYERFINKLRETCKP